MHWILDNNFKREEGYEALKDVIVRMGLPHTEVKAAIFGEVFPNPEEITPDLADGPVVVMGSMSLCDYAKKKGWSPGAFSNGYNFNHSAYKTGYGEHLLNYDGHVVKFGEADTADPSLDVFFMRPYHDTKSFAGATFSRREFQNWQEKIRQIQDENYTTISSDTLVVVAPLKKILREYRFFIVDGRVITGSLYKMGDRVTYQENTDDAEAFAQRMVFNFEPSRAFVLDIALTEEGYKVIEANCFNSAGLYACDVNKIVHAVESMGYS